MEEQRIFLQPDDEITDVIDKLEKTEKDIVVLIIPKSAIIMQSIINLKLLKRKAEDLNKRLAIVTDSSWGRKLIEKVGISVYRKAKIDKITKTEKKRKVADETKERFPLALDDQDKLEEKTEPEQPSISFTKKSAWTKWFLIFCLVIVILVGGVLAFIYLPKATINIKLKAETEAKSFPIVIKDTKNLKNNQVAGELVETTAKVVDNFDATGKKEIGGLASGRVIVYNYWSSDSQLLVKNTRFIHNTSGKVFNTSSSVTVPGTTVVEGQTVAGTAIVTIQAAEKGESYNVAASRFTIPGLPTVKQQKIYGETETGISGGFQKEVLVVSKSDYDSAKAKLAKELESKAIEQFQSEIAGRTMLEEKIEKIIQDTTVPAIGQEAGSFKLTLQKKIIAMVYSETEYLDKIKEKFDGKISQERELSLDGLAKRIKITKSQFDLKPKSVTLSLKINGLTIPKLEQDILLASLINKRETEAEKYLIGYSQIQDADVELWPFWSNRVTDHQNRVIFEYSYDK